MVLRANPSRLLVAHVAAGVAQECAELAKTFRGPGSVVHLWCKFVIQSLQAQLSASVAGLLVFLTEVLISILSCKEMARS